MQKTFIIDGLRIPTGKKNGYYKNIIPEVFTAHILKYYRKKYPFLNKNLDELILGCSIGTGGNMARYSLLEAGFDLKIPATTIDYQCGSGLKSIQIADSQIKSNQSSCILAGGFESNSLAPKRQYAEKDFRFSYKDIYYEKASFAPLKFGENDLLKAAENVAKEFRISKKEMVNWTLKSHEKAKKSIENIFLSEKIIPYLNFKKDQTIKEDLSLEKIQKLSSENLIDFTNSAHLHDGACILLLADEKTCFENNLKPKFEILATESCGIEPNFAPKGIISATKKLIIKYNFSMKSIDLFDINESFALKPLIFAKHFNVDLSKINILGGNLAFGHPFGASGAMNLLHLMAALEIKKKEFGLTSIAVAGGQGISMLIKRL